MSSTTQAAAFETCRLWVESATSLVANYVRQPVADAARPQKPYLTVEWPTDVAIGATPFERVEEEIDPDPGTYDHMMRRYQRRQGTFRVEAFGDGAFDRLIDLRLSLRDVINKALLRDAGVAVTQLGEVVDTSTDLDATWEESAIADFAAIYMKVHENPVAIIENVTVDVEMGAFEGDPDPLEVTITTAV